MTNGQLGTPTRGALSVPHSYSLAGFYDARVRITDDNGGYDEVQSIKVAILGANARDGVLYVIGNDNANSIQVNRLTTGQTQVVADFVPGGYLTTNATAIVVQATPIGMDGAPGISRGTGRSHAGPRGCGGL